MKKKHFLAVALIAATSMLASLPAFAISVTDFEKLDAKAQTHVYLKIINDYTAKAYQINEKTGDAVTNYFANIPPGSSVPLGFTAFDARLRSTLKTASRTDEDEIQIENIIALGIKEDVMDKLANQNVKPKPPQAPAGPASSAKPSN